MNFDAIVRTKYTLCNAPFPFSYFSRMDEFQMNPKRLSRNGAVGTAGFFWISRLPSVIPTPPWPGSDGCDPRVGLRCPWRSPLTGRRSLRGSAAAAAAAAAAASSAGAPSAGLEPDAAPRPGLWVASRGIGGPTWAGVSSLTFSLHARPVYQREPH